MKRWSRLALTAVVLCLGAACGTMRTQRAAPPAPVGRDSVKPQLERSEASAASISGSDTAIQETRHTRASSVGKWGSTESHPTDASNGGGKPPARALPKWNPIWWFGNVDDPEPPAWYRPGSPSRRWLWQLRNPLHNFTFHVIGVADKPLTRTGKFPAAVFAPDGGWNWAVTRCGWCRLPFVSFNGEWCRGYFGWRERGNFGCKVNCGRTKPPDARLQTPAEPWSGGL